MKTSVNMAIIVMLLLATAAGANAAPSCNYDGDGFTDVSCAPGHINKNGKGSAVVALSEGNYTVNMNGEGRMFLIGLQDYRVVKGNKDGDGDLIWVPNDDKKPSFGPQMEKNGKGNIGPGEWATVVEERKKHSLTR